MLYDRIRQPNALRLGITVSLLALVVGCQPEQGGGGTNSNPIPKTTCGQPNHNVTHNGAGLAIGLDPSQTKNLLNDNPREWKAVEDKVTKFINDPVSAQGVPPGS